VPLKTRRALTRIGHDVQPETTFASEFGSGDIIAVDPDTGALWAGSDPRKDGCAAGF
jgi:gamma-glutamyltranspeptidase/glutathione hydrolase